MTYARHSGTGSATLAVLAEMLFCACGGRSSTEDAAPIQLAAEGGVAVEAGNEAPSAEAQPPEVLRIESGGGQCATDCWLTVDVDFAGEMVLEDERGTERFELERAEVDDLWSILVRPAMLAALQDPNDCYSLNGSARAVVLTWPEGNDLSDETSLSCFVDTTHPYRLAYDRVELLIDKYLACSPSVNGGEGTRAICKGR
jgi:hypothetical protein